MRVAKSSDRFVRAKPSPRRRPGSIPRFAGLDSGSRPGRLSGTGRNDEWEASHRDILDSPSRFPKWTLFLATTLFRLRETVASWDLVPDSLELAFHINESLDKFRVELSGLLTDYEFSGFLVRERPFVPTLCG
jgi:hypothetical protein